MKHILFFLALFYALLIQQLCLAQSIPKQGTKDQITEESRIEPIPASEIARSSNESSLKLNEIQKLIKPDAQVIKIDSLLNGYVNEVDSDKIDLEQKNLTQMTLRRLKEFEDEWLGHKRKLGQWQAILESQIKSIESQAQRLNKLKAQWSLTEDASVSERYPAAVQQQIQSLMNDLKEVDNELVKQQGYILTLQGKTSREALIVTEQTNRLTSAIQDAQKRLFEADSSPIWKMFKDTEKDLSIAEQLHQTQRTRSVILKDFFDNNYERIMIHCSIFIILLIILLYFKNNIKEFKSEEKDQELITPTHILNRPVSTALLLTLLMTRVLYPQAPDEIYKLNGIIGLIPILRILIGIIPKDMRLSVYGLTVLYLIEKIYEIPYEHPLFPRLILLILTGLTLVGLIWLTISKRPSIDRRWGKDWKWIRFVMRSGIVLLVISLLANIFGFVGLSSLLTSAFLKSIYLAVAFLTSVIVLDGLFSIMLRARMLQTLHMVRVRSEYLKTNFRRILTFAAYITWIFWTLANFNLYDPIIGGMLAIFSKRWTIGNFAVSLGDIIAFSVAIWLSLKISKFIRFILNEDVLPRIKLPRGVPGSISILVHYLILAFGFIIAMAAAGIEWSRFAILAGALGVGIGFGLQNVVNNFVSGLVLIFERPIKVGDTIEVGTLLGTVKRIGIRSSTIRTYTGAEIIVPNGNLISNEVINWTLSDRLRRIDIAIGVAYGTDPKKLVKILENVAIEHEQVLNDPPPLVLFKGFGDSSLDFELRFWTANFDTWLRLKSEITIQVEAAIKKAKIEIPFPQRDLHVRSVDPNIQRSTISEKNLKK